MARYSAQITGMRAAQRAFKDIVPVSKAHIISATEDTCIAIRNKAVALVRVRHGYLRSAINWAVNKNTGEGRVGLTRGKRMGALGVFMGAKGAEKQSARIHRYASGRTTMEMPSKYGHFVEFGTKERRTKKGAYRGRMPATGFMIPAAESERVGFATRMKAEGPKIERDLSVGRFQ